MTESTDTVPAPGRPIRLEAVAPGFWMTTLGVCIAALAPLLGFLIGVMSRQPQGEGISPIYLGLFSGVIVGGLGVASAVIGGIRLWRHYRSERPA